LHRDGEGRLTRNQADTGLNSFPESFGDRADLVIARREECNYEIALFVRAGFVGVAGIQAGDHDLSVRHYSIRLIGDSSRQFTAVRLGD
jgi:hypothetical protein